MDTLVDVKSGNMFRKGIFWCANWKKNPPPSPAVLLSTTEIPFWTAVSIFAKAWERKSYWEDHIQEESPAHKCHGSEQPSNQEAPRRKPSISCKWYVWYVLCKWIENLLETSLITASNIAAVDPGVPTPAQVAHIQEIPAQIKLPIVSPRLIS